MAIITKTALAVALAAGFVGTSQAADLTGAATADARTKVATAIALANIATAEKDGEALLVAAKLLASAGPVAKPGETVKDGKPTLFDAAAMAASAKELGADAARADAVAQMPSASVRGDGYWYYSCDSYNNCQWIYVGW